MPALEITTMIGCPLRCTYCPQDSLKAAYRSSMSLGLKRRVPWREVQNKFLKLKDFETVLSKLPAYVRIDFSGMSEPWANPDATHMLEAALSAGRSVAIYTTLHGISRKDSERIVALLHSHLDQLEVLCLHLPDANGSMRGWKHSSEYEKVLRLFIDFGRSELSGSFVREAPNSTTPRFQVMTMDGSGRVNRRLAHLALELPAWEGHTRAGTLSPSSDKTPSLKPVPRHNAAVSCMWTPFYDRNVLLPNGDVVLCCMDYALKHVLGNLFANDYESLFRSEEMAKIRYVNAQPEFSKCTLCKSCDDALVYTLDRTSWRERPQTGFELVGLAADGWLSQDAEINVYVPQPAVLHLSLRVPDWLPASFPFEIRLLRNDIAVDSWLVQGSGKFEVKCPLNEVGVLRIEGGEWFRPSEHDNDSADDRLLCLRVEEQDIVTS